MSLFKDSQKTGLLLLLITGLFISCSDTVSSEEELDNDEVLITLDEAEQEVLELMKEWGFFSTSFFEGSQDKAKQAGPPPVPDNYVSSRHDDSGHILIEFWIGSDGYIIPNSDWRENNQDYCMEQNRWMKPPIKKLTKRIVPNTGIVFIQIVNVETSDIDMQREGQGDLNEQWLREAIEDAWDQLVEKDGLDIKGAGDPCGDEAQLIMEFKSTINHQITTSDGHNARVNSTVSSKIPLTFSETEQLYSGNGNLEYVDSEYYNSISEVPELSCSFDFHEGELNTKVDFPEAGFRYSPNIEMVVGDFTINEMPSVTYTCTDAEGNMSQGEDNLWWSSYVLMNQQRGISETQLFYSNWQESEDRMIIAFLEVEASESFSSEDGELTITEETVIGIRHAE